MDVQLLLTHASSRFSRVSQTINNTQMSHSFEKRFEHIVLVKMTFQVSLIKEGQKQNQQKYFCKGPRRPIILILQVGFGRCLFSYLCKTWTYLRMFYILMQDYIKALCLQIGLGKVSISFVWLSQHKEVKRINHYCFSKCVNSTG